MTVQEILNEWESGAPFSEKTIREAVRHQKELTPHLIGILEQAAGGPETCADRENCNGPLYALFLLAQFRETSAYPAVVNFCRIPEEPLDLLIGDVITKDLRRILASVFDGDAAPIKGLIEDPNVYGYVRGAGVEALTDLVLEGIIQREEVMAYFKELLSTRLEREPFSELWATVVCQAADLYPGEVQEEIREAFRDELLDDSWIDEMEVKAVLDKGMECCMETTREAYKGLIEDAALELSSWLVHDDDGNDDYPFYDLDDFEEEFEDEEPVSVLDELRGYEMDLHNTPTPYRFSGTADPNDPCPCGSGKKFKKCCGRTDINPPAR